MRTAVKGRPRARASGRHGQDLNHTAKGASAVQIASRAAHHFHAIHRGGRHAVPIHPAAERVVQCHAVGQHQRAAGTRPGDTAQRDALRRGVGHARRTAPEQGEPWRRPQGIVQRAGGHVVQLGSGDHRSAGRTRQAFSPASGSDHDRVGKVQGSQHDVDRLGPADRHIGRLEPCRCHANRRGECAGVKVASRIAADGHLAPIRGGDDHLGVGDDAARNIHDAATRGRRGRLRGGGCGCL